MFKVLGRHEKGALEGRRVDVLREANEVRDLYEAAM